MRGSETDVLSRYHLAAVQTGADVIVRVTSDCPLLDPSLAATVLSLVIKHGADYACNNMPRSWPHGLDCEAFRFYWLNRAAAEATLSSEIEHVTPYMRNHSDVRKLVLQGPGGAIVNNRWTLDTNSDMKLLQAVFARLPRGRDGFDYRVPLDIVTADPSLAALNASAKCETW